LHTAAVVVQLLAQTVAVLQPLYSACTPGSHRDPWTGSCPFSDVIPAAESFITWLPHHPTRVTCLESASSIARRYVVHHGVRFDLHQCKWMLRAAWNMQELLSTFGTELGEVGLVPSTGGIYRISIFTDTQPMAIVLWDRKEQSGFPESKVLKQLVRDVIDPARDLGHIDKIHKMSDQVIDH